MIDADAVAAELLTAAAGAIVAAVFAMDAEEVWSAQAPSYNSITFKQLWTMMMPRRILVDESLYIFRNSHTMSPT